MNARNTINKPARSPKAKPANKIGWTEAPPAPKPNPLVEKFNVLNRAGVFVCVACGHKQEAHDKTGRCVVFYDAVDEEQRCEVNIQKLGSQRNRMAISGKARRSTEDYLATEEAQETRYGGPTRLKRVVASGRGVDHHFMDGSISRADW